MRDYRANETDAEAHRWGREYLRYLQISLVFHYWARSLAHAVALQAVDEGAACACAVARPPSALYLPNPRLPPHPPSWVFFTFSSFQEFFHFSPIYQDYTFLSLTNITFTLLERHPSSSQRYFYYRLNTMAILWGFIAKIDGIVAKTAVDLWIAFCFWWSSRRRRNGLSRNGPGVRCKRILHEDIVASDQYIDGISTPTVMMIIHQEWLVEIRVCSIYEWLSDDWSGREEGHQLLHIGRLFKGFFARFWRFSKPSALWYDKKQTLNPRQGVLRHLECGAVSVCQSGELRVNCNTIVIY